jgi:BirA family transcriptional regulator, biotin operon repressor / biotin---[acetyl-CoA-carboxylase] ligase
MATSGAHLHWAADALWQQLEPLLPGVSVEVQARVESTNSVLLERARQGSGRRDAPITTPGELDALRRSGRDRDDRGPHGRRADDTQPCLLVAEHQTLGRGRQGRGWLSAPGASLTFSLGLPMAPRDWSGLSLAVGLALADALEPPAVGAAPRIGLKWPNDLWLRDVGGSPGCKLGGILIETVAVGARRMVVVGVGLNIAPLPLDDANEPLDEAVLTHGYAALQELLPGIGAPDVLHRVALPLARALLRFEQAGFGADLAHAYAARDLLRGRHIVALDNARASATLDGVAEGVSSEGALRLRAADGRVHEISSGEVSIRLGAGSGAVA